MSRSWEIREPKPKKVALRRSILPLLIELDQQMEEFHRLTEILAEPGTAHTLAVNAGADRKTVEAIIAGITWRINKASKGLQ